MDSLREKLNQWLSGHDSRLEEFWNPIPLDKVGSEIHESEERIREFLQQDASLCYHVWEHNYRGPSRSKPYCLRLNGPNTVGLDWENSIIGSAEAVFRTQGYQTARELGTEDHISSLISNPDLSVLKPRANTRDFWALKKDGKSVDLYIIEAKGKEAYEFDYYCFAEALSQVFPTPSEPLSALLGAKRASGRGLCWQFALQLREGWIKSGYAPTVTVGLLLPEWTPDIVWSGGKVREIEGCYYARPLSDFRKFIETGETDSKSGNYKYQRAFGEVLDGLEKNFRIRSLYRAKDQIRFRLITARLSPTTKAFELTGLER